MASPFKSLNSFLFLLFSSLLVAYVHAEPYFISTFCTNDTGNYTRNSFYQIDLSNALSALTTQSSAVKFYNTTAGEGINKVYALYYCRGDLDSQDCEDCVQAAAKQILADCEVQKEAIVWYKECTLRYANRPIFSFAEESPSDWYWSLSNVTNTEEFTKTLGETMNNVIDKATSTGFAMGQGNVTAFQTVYCLAQCTPDIVGSSCNRCLRSALKDIPSCCSAGSNWAMINYPSCRLMYDLSPIGKSNSTSTEVSRNGAHGAPPPETTGSLVHHEGKDVKLTIIIIAASVATSAALVLAGIGFCLCWRYKKTKSNVDSRESKGESAAVSSEYKIEGAVEFDLKTLKAATTNFSTVNRLGEGGFGVVYRGKLENGEEVGIKRLSEESRQGIKEFSNEVQLVARLQHRNLVKLVGFCAQGEEILLVYEFLPNLSLDKYLFDQSKSKFLTWEERHKIMIGIARGLHYLHEDSRHMIVHRDLKPSNVLLDEDMNPKIADFGMARLVPVDHTQGNTSKVVGTFGYMAPEYVLAGRFSFKSDVYSFGVMLLEIVSGRRNTLSSPHDDGLLRRAWKLWREGGIEELADPAIKMSASRMDLMRCVQIALLCVQDDAASRPTMQAVLLMLSSNSVELPYPLSPSSQGQTSRILIPSMTTPRTEYQELHSASESTGVSHFEKDLYPR